MYKPFGGQAQIHGEFTDTMTNHEMPSVDLSLHKPTIADFDRATNTIPIRIYKYNWLLQLRLRLWLRLQLQYTIDKGRITMDQPIAGG